MSERTYSHYRTGTCTLTAQGFADPPPQVEARWVREGHIVHLFVPPVEGTSNAPTFTLEALPELIRPSAMAVHLARVDDSGEPRAGLVTLAAGQDRLEVHAGAGIDTFASSGAKRLYACALHYLAIPGQQALEEAS